MKLNTTVTLMNLDGEPLMEQKREFTVGMAIAGALVAPQRDKQFKPVEAMDRYELAMEIRTKDEIVLEPEQVVLCKDCVCSQYAPLISGQICKMLVANKNKQEK